MRIVRIVYQMRIIVNVGNNDVGKSLKNNDALPLPLFVAYAINKRTSDYPEPGLASVTNRGCPFFSAQPEESPS